MAYSLQIERLEPIKIDELLAVIETSDDLRIEQTDAVSINPVTGAEIRIPGTKADIALWFSEIKEWIKVFSFQRNRIVFKANDWDNPKSPVRDKAYELARKLNAEIVGEDGEKY